MAVSLSDIYNALNIDPPFILFTDAEHLPNLQAAAKRARSTIRIKAYRGSVDDKEWGIDA